MKKIIAILCSLLMVFNVPIVSAEENVMVVEDIMPAATYISSLSAGIAETSAGCIAGEVGGVFTGDGLHAIYQTNIQYLASTGVWTNLDSGHPFRAYSPGVYETFEIYYCYPEEGVQYRVHVYMRVVDSNGNLKDAAVTNSPIFGACENFSVNGDK